MPASKDVATLSNVIYRQQRQTSNFYYLKINRPQKVDTEMLVSHHGRPGLASLANAQRKTRVVPLLN
jgi:hypothetical protein